MLLWKASGETLDLEGMELERKVDEGRHCEEMIPGVVRPCRVGLLSLREEGDSSMEMWYEREDRRPR